MNGRLIPVRDISAADERRWRQLAERAIDANPLGEPDCVIPAARYQEFGSEIVLAVVEHQDRFVASLPLRPFRYWYDIHYPIIANRIRRGANMASPLLDPDFAPEAAESLFTTLARERRHLGHLLGLDSLRVGSPVERLLLDTAQRMGLRTYIREDFERGFLVRRPNGDYTGHLNYKYLWNVRSRRRRIAAHFDSGPVLRDRAQDARALDEFVELEASGYKAGNVALTAVPGDPQYFCEMCTRFARDRRLHLLSLEAGGITLAMLIWLRAGDGFLQLKTAYDERYRCFGPGIILQIDSFSFFHEQTDGSWIDTCASPNNDTFLKLFPDRTRISTILFSLGGRVDAMIVGNMQRIFPAQRLVRAWGSPFKRVAKRIVSQRGSHLSLAE